jgi:hypothetical protein
MTAMRAVLTGIMIDTSEDVVDPNAFLTKFALHLL